jgi:hypothetical protein
VHAQRMQGTVVGGAEGGSLAILGDAAATHTSVEVAVRQVDFGTSFEMDYAPSARWILINPSR